MSDDNKVDLQGFAAKITQENKVWALQGDEGWAISDSIEFEETDVLLFFSNEIAAKQLCNGEWQDYKPTSLSLDEFLEDWLPGMHEDNVMVGLEWDIELEGQELEPADVAAAFS